MWSGKQIQTRIEFSTRIEERTTGNSHHGTIGIRAASLQACHRDPVLHRTTQPNPGRPVVSQIGTQDIRLGNSTDCQIGSSSLRMMYFPITGVRRTRLQRS